MTVRVLDWARTDVVKSRTTRRAIGVLVFAMATAFGARIAIPLPGTQIPFTLQVIAVLLAGTILGPRLGAASQALYVTIGAMGAPIFAAGGGLAYLFGPTGGYLLAFPVAAFVVGAIAGRETGVLRLLAALAAGVLVILAGGTSWLAIVTGDPGQAVATGFVPFLWNDLVEIGLALLISNRLRPRALELF